ncbi:uncharacterized protein [Phaseolus vulgaris]|uniref:uncharacterized protein n=1 Tax=Phaseolus vulgaris TaxID=3885 RepID=UPI0035CA1508
MKYEQIAELLNGIAERFDWDKIMEGDKIIGLKQCKECCEGVSSARSVLKVCLMYWAIIYWGATYGIDMIGMSLFNAIGPAVGGTMFLIEEVCQLIEQTLDIKRSIVEEYSIM